MFLSPSRLLGRNGRTSWVPSMHRKRKQVSPADIGFCMFPAGVALFPSFPSAVDFIPLSGDGKAEAVVASIDPNALISNKNVAVNSRPTLKRKETRAKLKNKPRHPKPSDRDCGRSLRAASRNGSFKNNHPYLHPKPPSSTSKEDAVSDSFRADTHQATCGRNRRKSEHIAFRNGPGRGTFKEQVCGIQRTHYPGQCQHISHRSIHRRSLRHSHQSQSVGHRRLGQEGAWTKNLENGMQKSAAVGWTPEQGCHPFREWYQIDQLRQCLPGLAKELGIKRTSK